MRTPGAWTARPDGTDRQHLGYIGHIALAKHSTTLPGGDDQMSLTLLCQSPGRPGAIRAGRTVTLTAGGLLWTGRLDEPLPAPGGWQVSAHGQGTFGANWQAYYPAKYGGNAPVDQAISRGLPWVNAGLEAHGIDAQQLPDPAQPTIEEHLTAITDPMTKTWQVSRDGVVDTIALPSAPTRLVVLTKPAGRSLAEVVTKLWIRYQSGTDKYSTTSVENAAAAADAGTTERFADFSDAGVISQSTAQSRGSAILAKYTAAGWAGPITVPQGRVLTLAGAEVDLATERAGEVYKPLFAGPASEGEWAGLPPYFVTAQAEYDWEAGTIALTPLESVRRSLSDLLSALAPKPKT